MKSWKQWHISANIERIKSLASYTQNTDTSLSVMGASGQHGQATEWAPAAAAVGAGEGGQEGAGASRRGSAQSLSPPGALGHTDPQGGECDPVGSGRGAGEGPEQERGGGEEKKQRGGGEE